MFAAFIFFLSPSIGCDQSDNHGINILTLSHRCLIKYSHHVCVPCCPFMFLVSSSYPFLAWYGNLPITFSCFSCFLVTHYVTDPYFYAVFEKAFAYSLIFLMSQQWKKNDILIRKIKQQRVLKSCGKMYYSAFLKKAGNKQWTAVNPCERVWLFYCFL